ncbi:hypothetical protein QBC47DRAFT_398278 [Echria macrotheca]|uniref:Uncharacterized protein n=1 Tax=Echria macrotheca TaxID=438768 RepID=A0AAJ0BJR2_9PEZI|nr:hypothetical protein QBC47DRAFT_398278 [Echria macrotheca]
MAPSYEPGLETAPPAGLEIAHQQYPEVNYQNQQYQQPPTSSHGYSQYPYTTPPTKPTPSPSFASPYSAPSPHAAAAYAAAPPPPTKSRTICGCTLLVFVLSCIIAILSAAVIGLAAGTGVEAGRANDATAQLAVISSSLAAATATRTGSAPAATAVASGVVDDGCADDPNGVTGSNYTSFPLLGGLKFTRYCNRDAKFAPLMSLFTSSFSTCMDACAAYSKYVPTMFGRNDNATCGAVSFIPLWTTKANATAGGAPGNCYLKPGPQNASTLSVPNIGTPCHAAFWTEGSS